MNCKVRPADKKDALIIFQFISELEKTNFEYALFESYYLTNICNEQYVYLVAIQEEIEVVGYISCHGQIERILADLFDTDRLNQRKSV